MEPGPKLDELIATKIMGWHLSQDRSQWLRPNGEHAYGASEWTPSTDIRQAMHVQIRAGIFFTHQETRKGFRVLWGPANEYQAEGLTHAHAVCCGAIENMNRLSE